MAGFLAPGTIDEEAGLFRVLVVDDDPGIRQLIQWALEDEGIAVDTAGDGRQALERAASGRPGLVVLDLTLPLLDGIGVGRILRSTYGAELPILVITARGDAASAARELGACAHLAKPFDVDRLVALVRGVLSTPWQ